MIEGVYYKITGELLSVNKTRSNATKYLKTSYKYSNGESVFTGDYVIYDGNEYTVYLCPWDSLILRSDSLKVKDENLKDLLGSTNPKNVADVERKIGGVRWLDDGDGMYREIDS